MQRYARRTVPDRPHPVQPGVRGPGSHTPSQTEGSAHYAAFKKVPSPKLMVQVTGVLMLIGSDGVIFGIWMDLAALGLAILVLVMAGIIHRACEEADVQTKQVEISQS